ncbi:uncharacterized protein CELE_C54E4.1 [Caenorhabditis elegans]|uniref:Uncharacterized protein n=1 Tax=Caenorhabditis elegans TaxID=6239 RepID=O44470_CAEEL|nr:Uncharacterized protein CELE_C54E4.1 [Caenorhabditis elegans]CCD68034.1 Uncharacterized protein CELE_C54E4.1 [Caenorhabditis elegans]|eukprot:NP_500173.1 Uncharacterized protein CELE_C54E4.1 [Caenorhabditis elegans]
MGGSQSTTSSRAAKFSGTNSANRRSVRAVRSAPATELNARRATSCRNTNRNVKEFSKFWSDAGSINRSKSSNRASMKQKQNGNGSIRRNRTQSVDVRRASNCLPVPGTPSTIPNPQLTQRRATSFRSNGSSTSSTLTVNGEGRKSRKGSTTELLTPNSARSDIYSIEFNQAAIAAARLKRLSLTPYPDPQLPRLSPLQQQQPHHRSNSTKKSVTSSVSPKPRTQQPRGKSNSSNNHLKSPETAIY